MDVFTLDDRLQCIFEKRPGTGVVAAQIWVKVGSKYEEPEIAGVTHFVEHLIFKGTEKLKGNEMASRIESLGGTINAFTSYDNTVYHITIPKDAFEEGFQLLMDAVKNPAFPEEEIKKEKKVVLEEIRMGEDDPQRKLFRDLFSLSYQGHPYGRPVIGFRETVGNLGRKEINDYFKGHYRPDNMIVVLVGDFEETSAQALVGQYLLDKTDGVTRKPLLLRPPSQKKGQKEFGHPERGEGDRYGAAERELRESYLALSYPVPFLGHEDMPAIAVLATILGDGESSRLQDELKHKRAIVENSYAYLFSPREAGLFIVYATFKGREYTSRLEGITDVIAAIGRNGVADWELKKAKNIIEASYIYGAETVQGRARQMGNYATITEDPLFVDKFLKRVEKVTAQDLIRVAEKYIIGQPKNVLTLLPKDKENPHTFVLKNGLTVVINKNNMSPSFAFRIGFIGGTKEEERKKNGIFNLLSKMMLKDTAGKDSTTIARTIDTLAGDISPYTGRNVFGLAGKFLSKDIGEVLPLVRELIVETSLKEEAVENVKREVLSEIRQKEDDPISFTFQRFNELLYNEHPYAADPKGREETVRSITAADLRDTHARYVGPGNAVLAISGKGEEKELLALVERCFSDWKGAGQPLRKAGPETPKAQEKHIAKEILQTHLVFGFPAPGLIDDERYAVEVLDAILSGMGGRIHKILREENPYAYAVTFFNQMAYEAGAMGIYIGTDRQHLKHIDRLVRTEVKRIHSEGFTDKEVENAKTYLVGTHYVSMQSNNAIATSMCLDTLYGLKPNYFKVWPSRIKAVTKDDVNRIARKYLLLSHMVKLSTGK